MNAHTKETERQRERHLKNQKGKVIFFCFYTFFPTSFLPLSLYLLPLRCPLVRVVVQEPLDEVDVGHEHAAAAVALQAQRVEGVAVMFFLFLLSRS